MGIYKVRWVGSEKLCLGTVRYYRPLKRPGSLDQTWHFILWFKIIVMENLRHDFMCIILFSIYFLIGAHEVHSPQRFSMWIILNHRLKYTRQLPGLLIVELSGIQYVWTVYTVHTTQSILPIRLIDSYVILYICIYVYILKIVFRR